MFSGIIESLGTIVGVEAKEGAATLTIRCDDLAGELALGDSVAVDGACLTVESRSGREFSVTAVATTLDRTIAGTYNEGTIVNLERALRVGDRLDGHFVQGHVDGVARLVDVDRRGSDVKLHFDVPAEIAKTTLNKGSITLNGVSLTVADGPAGPDGNRIGVAVIPFTLGKTNLSTLKPNDVVNVEADLIGKYVGRMVASGGLPSLEIK